MISTRERVIKCRGWEREQERLERIPGVRDSERVPRKPKTQSMTKEREKTRKITEHTTNKPPKI
ncbi:hypothetical protein AGABI2DRAFT_191643 [Agaricus bisporus var. bisporus H97]|uniref:hypothetical protein n=1 Tax=Agaricus bisporus var. bisporus (strain H97 / ATCC MYA-4626 / FGSC 10389) TaxID=936046 RepID=UPI00029F7D20|nr:hypothetical protein AGABI2DRAFT_191643 [Agaricus bisporus var. bisporus H97]EKV47933.1 hypothetical protein AGABI2DRAFT_191643 [Agaricus bisporus var. bisporus H97]